MFESAYDMSGANGNYYAASIIINPRVLVLGWDSGDSYSYVSGSDTSTKTRSDNPGWQWSNCKRNSICVPSCTAHWRNSTQSKSRLRFICAPIIENQILGQRRG